MIEDMEDKGILDKARMEGMNQGVWLSVQELAHDGRWTQAAEELVSEIDDSSCDGCVFNNRGYYCMYSCCCNIDREDNTDVIYKEVKRS